MKRLTLGDVCKKASSNIAQKDLQDKMGVYPIYGASGLIKQVDFYQQDKEYIAVVKDGAGIGRTMLLPAYSSVIGTMQYLLPKEGIPIDIKYLFYAVEHMNLAKYFSGATIPHIYFKDYQKEPINIPDIDTQRKISRIFDKIDALITSRKEQRTKLDQIVKSRFIEMFGNFVYERDRWNVCTIGDVADTIDPQPSHRTPPISLDGIPYVGIAECNYSTRRIDFEKARKVGQNVLREHTERYTLDEGDFIIGKIGTIGKPFFIPIEQTYTLSANTVLIKPIKGKVVSQYLYAVFQSEYMDRIIDAEKKSTSQPAFGIQKVRRIEIPMPPLELQQQFAAFVAQTDKSKYRQEKCIGFFQCLEKSIRQEWL